MNDTDSSFIIPEKSASCLGSFNRKVWKALTLILAFVPSILGLVLSVLLRNLPLVILVASLTSLLLVYLGLMSFKGPGHVVSLETLRKESISDVGSDDIQSKTASSKTEYEASPQFWMEINSKDVSILEDFKTHLVRRNSGRQKQKTLEPSDVENQRERDNSGSKGKASRRISLGAPKPSMRNTDLEEEKREPTKNKEDVVRQLVRKKKRKLKERYLKIQGNSGKEAMINICTKCRIINFENNKHCFNCDKCVKFFDHHSRVLDVCIGQKNLHLYFQFIFLYWGFLLSFLILVISLLLKWLTISEYVLVNKDNHFQPSRTPFHLDTSGSTGLLAQNPESSLHPQNHIQGNGRLLEGADLLLMNSLQFSQIAGDNFTNLVCGFCIFILIACSIYFFYLSYLVLVYVELLGKNIPASEYSRKLSDSRTFSFKVFFQKVFGTFHS